MQRVPMTLTGVKALREELDFLKRVARPKIVNAIAEARALGDLSENAEYHAAKEQQVLLEGKISDLEMQLALAEVIDISKIPNEGKVIFGAIVTIVNLETDQEVTYQIVGDNEADLSKGKISINSPIARAIISKTEGDVVTVQAPAGQIDYEILEVKYI